MSRVSKIESQKKRKGRYNIFVDDKFAVGMSEKELLEAGIFKDREISKGDLEELKEKSKETKIKDKALRFLSIRPRSISELKKKLEEKNFDSKTIKKTISWLKKEGYLNDKKFAKDWIFNRKKFHPLGKRRIFLELTKKEVDPEIIRKELLSISLEEEISLAIELAERRIKLYRGEDKYKKREKVIAFLQRRGYNWDVISKAIEGLNFG